VGMNNPYGSDERYALYPEPRGAAGDRLCRVILGMTMRDYMRSFVRRNTMKGEWNIRGARLGAAALLQEVPPGATIVLLGRQVWEAWKSVVPPRLCQSRPGEVMGWDPFKVCKDQIGDLTFVLFPHPSGLCRVWNDKSNVPLARETLRVACPELEAVVPQ
jgi:hypothetical protein